MLFRKDIEKICAYCCHAGRIDDETMLCKRKGFVASSGTCLHFRYDPLKRVPKQPTQDIRGSFTDEDFSL